MARIAVIGAGMGAMAAAARLAVAGHRVTVYERSETHGGGVRRFVRDGFGFDTGPGLLHLPAVYRDLFVKTGKEPLERCVGLTQVDPASRHVFADGTAVSLPNASRAGVVSALDDALGRGAGERWAAFLNRARDTWDRSRRPLLEEPLPADVAPFSRDPYPAPRTGLLRRTAATLAEVGRRELGGGRLAALLEGYALAYGLDPATAPPSAAVLPYMEQTFGTWYVRGGLRALADAVYARCLERRVEFVFGAEVTGVVEEDGRAAGVELADGRVAGADLVVAGAPVPALYHGHVVAWERQDAWPRFQTGVATGRVTVCLALRGAREEGAAHRTVVHSADPAGERAFLTGGGPPCGRPTVVVLRPDDAELRPDAGHEAVTVTATVPAGGPGAPDDPWGAEGVAEAFADRMVETAGAAVPGLRERLLWREVRTPAHTAEETGSRRVPAPALAGGGGVHLPAANAAPLPGLYFAGGWSHPGGGLAHAGMSGALVAGLVVEGAGFRGSR
ncbi:phytoene desaturase family protein [Streptomyces sudanensis]|uniref:phytoene desaturase family protein n=1 Tax=Streptomyces sudanensis TaxID=436397 RepID=UPI0020CF9A29|nr:NAD(P)/FAD-dependent oxidoreductase [Streptomyces sudanensis]MCP9959310.1 NAD(P)/FAD-dependent oxidoreductase [Streptomyces sudanensis]MCQ0000234.1 NAD(P)/FAD-dependent oxidoreductase [Streptomyces sudanensis]